MTLDQLTTFRMISKTKNFRRAAEKLHLTQPAVSKQIQSLENELGERLFERGRTAQLTLAGATLLKHADRLSQIVRIARDEIADLKELRTGHLAIGASHTIASHLLPGVIEAYRLKYPQIALTVETGWSPEVLGRLAAHEVDLGLLMLTSPKADGDPQLTCVALDTAETVFIASPKDPRIKSEMTFEEFAKLPLILNHEGCLYRRYLAGRFAERGVPMNVAVGAIGFELEKKLTQLGLGVSLLSRLLVTKELKEKSLRTFKVKGLQLRSYSCLVYRRDKYLHGAMREFLKLLQKFFPKARLDPA